MLKRHVTKMVMVTASMLLAGSAQAALQLIQFEPNPISPSTPEFSWTGPGGNFEDAAGSHAALQIDTSLTAVAVNPALADETIDANGSHFDNATLLLSSTAGGPTLKDNGAGIVGGLAFQGLTDGSFTITAADGELLLAGVLQNNYLQIPLSSSAAGFEGGDVTYTGGLIFNALVASGGSVTGSAAISMTTVDGSNIAVTSTGLGEASVGAFTANANGVFDVTPEPASMGVVAVACVLASRRRRV